MMNRLKAPISLTAALLACALSGCAPYSPSPAGAEANASLGNPADAPTPTPAPEATPLPAATPAPSTGDPNCVDHTNDAAEIRKGREEICALTNSERLKVGALPLVLESRRSEVAQNHAVDMATRSYFSHTSPDGKSPGDRISAAGIQWRAWAENIAQNSRGAPSDIMTMWMNSAGHKTNILRTNMGRLGVGSYKGYWVQVFTD
ncbi:MAG TPA: CAP domain-containing protein [Bdellovibrionales bacterium]|jgi:uncharacterized protein YkwD|nr:CAP domain-containing protein [Bdellovibrionales bacterium]